jgi:hypothetical protein
MTKIRGMLEDKINVQCGKQFIIFRLKTTSQSQPLVKKTTSNGVASQRSMRVRELSPVPVGVDYVEVCMYVVKSHSTSQQESIHCKKAFFDIPVPGPDVTSQILPGRGNYDVIYKLFPPRESLVSDILAGDGLEYRKAFFTVYNQTGIVPR